ncbi:restriction endonuclease subunit S [Corynebacterium sanguinis]|nr:restriction endonuclease subunit S [Corynebacterium sanguinis]
MDYLDRETAEIDAFIADLLRARKLLGYRLKSIADEAIHAALPKVDQSRKGRYGTPDHPFGNDWIPLGALAAVGTGSLDTQDASENGIFPFFVRSDNIELSESATHHGEAVLTAGDGAGVGKVFHHYVGYFAAHQRVYVIEPGPKLEGRFLYWTLRTYFGDIVLAGTAKSTVESLRRPMLTGFPIPSLPLAEQRRIAEALDRANDEISEQLADAQKAIDLAQERRSALITVAVTGQIDVTKQGVSAAEQLRDELEVHV